MASVETGRQTVETGKRRSPYKEYLRGDTVKFSLQTLQPDGLIVSNDQEIVIEDVRGGGFFGKVLIPEEGNFVIKTSLPDPWYHLWRTVNWGFGDLPTKSDETEAQLEHLATRIIHETLPVVSSEKFYSPASLGYTRLTTGFAQVIERVVGRGPRFDLSENEFVQFRETQRELLELGTRLGLEHIGQIHPDNPFGMTNLWFDDKKRAWIWLDTISAIPHNGWIWPAFYFRFHKNVRERFNQTRPTFNRIHTELFRREIEDNKHLFTEEAYEQVLADINIYETIYARLATIQQLQQRDPSIVARATKETMVDVVTERAIYKLLADPTFRKEKVETLIRIIQDPQYRVSYFNKNVVLKGVERAFYEGIITEEELQHAWQTVESDGTNSHDAHRQKIVLASLQAYYIVSSEIINVIEASTYLSSAFAENKASTIALGLFIGWVLPSILRPASTFVTGALTKTDLRAAIKLSALPKVGAYLAVPAQIGVTAGNKSEQIWHYTVRNIIASLSRISPSGGWGTQIEAELWEKLGKRLEQLGKPKT